jgi:hypothetical protein
MGMRDIEIQLNKVKMGTTLEYQQFHPLRGDQPRMDIIEEILVVNPSLEFTHYLRYKRKIVIGYIY